MNSYRITILFFNYYGNYIGRFTPKEYKDGKVLLNQVKYYEDANERLYISKSMILVSLKNMHAFVKYYHKKGMPLYRQIGKWRYVSKRYKSK